MTPLMILELLFPCGDMTNYRPVFVKDKLDLEDRIVRIRIDNVVNERVSIKVWDHLWDPVIKHSIATRILASVNADIRWIEL